MLDNKIEWNFWRFMKDTYKAQRKRNMFKLSHLKPFELSRSGIELYKKCKRCFYLDRRCGTKQPPMYAYTLNNAVDELLKKEFDQHRIDGTRHSILIKNAIDAIPFNHPKINYWRSVPKRGISFVHEITNFFVWGAIDDVWINDKGDLIIVDYKATSSKSEVEITSRESYKRQLEVYQWIFRKNGFTVSDTCYFFYCNGDTSADNLGSALSFKISVLPHKGDDSWVEPTLFEIKECLSQNIIPEAANDCNYCNYWKAVEKHINDFNIIKKVTSLYQEPINVDCFGYTDRTKQRQLFKEGNL